MSGIDQLLSEMAGYSDLSSLNKFNIPAYEKGCFYHSTDS